MSPGAGCSSDAELAIDSGLDVNVVLYGVTDLAGAAIDLVYDPNQVDIDRIADGPSSAGRPAALQDRSVRQRIRYGVTRTRSAMPVSCSGSCSALDLQSQSWADPWLSRSCR